MTHYDLLGVPMDSTFDEIRSAYRRMAFENHPDRGGNESVMKALNEAYSVLRHPDRRSAYDRELIMQAAVHDESAARYESARTKAGRRECRNRVLLKFYLFTAPIVLVALFIVLYLGLDIAGAAGGRSPWLLIPGMVAALVISRNIRGFVLRYVEF